MIVAHIVAKMCVVIVSLSTGIDCGTLESLNLTNVMVPSMYNSTYNSVVPIVCAVGYSFKDDSEYRNATCRENGQWELIPDTPCQGTV